jgi:2-polyprenyl-6-methoxyphenol hydroxylase-like FAD-dependent oxidoreductase
MERHAIVIGASIAGLLAARVLSGHFDRVTVLEKDALPGPDVARKSVPQGNHIHVIWSGGAGAIERLLPGLWDEMRSRGAIAFDNSRDMCWFHRGVWKLRTTTGLVMYSQSRPLLEHRIRERVLALGNVRLVSEAAVHGPLVDEAGQRIRGVRVRVGGDDAALTDIAAELVVDASGRASRTPSWLEGISFEAPRESRVDIDLKYASRLYEVPARSQRDWQVMAIYGGPPDARRAGVIFPIEGNRWIVTLSGCLGDHPGGDEQGFLDFARGLDRPDLFEAIREARPLSPISVYGFASEVRRHYEALDRLPGGLVVIGDALCAFNPLYGQGVTVCALEAEALDRCLRALDAADPPGEDFARQYFRNAAGVVGDAWLVATATDLLFPAARGRRPPGLGVFGWYNRQVLELCSCDPRVLRRFLEVLHFLKRPAALFGPRTFLAACRWSLGLRTPAERAAAGISTARPRPNTPPAAASG